MCRDIERRDGDEGQIPDKKIEPQRPLLDTLVWEDVHQRYLAAKPMPSTQVDMAQGAQREQQAA